MAGGSRCSEGQDPLFFDYADPVNVSLEEADRSIAAELNIHPLGANEHPFTWESTAIRNRSHERYLLRYAKTPAATADRPTELNQVDGSKSWRSFAVALLVIAIICGLIILAIFFVTIPDNYDCKRPPYCFDCLFNETLQSRKLRFAWIGDTVFLAQGGKLLKFNADLHNQLSQSDVVLTTYELNQREIPDFVPSSDEKFVAIQSRTSPTSDGHFQYLLYDTTDKSVRWASSRIGDDDGKGKHELQYFEWCPIKQPCFAAVYRNDLYFVSDVRNISPTRLSTTGKPGLVINGLADRIYQQEVIASGSATKMFWWSPTATKIAYVQTNLTRVPLNSFASFDGLYPRPAQAHYIRAGDTRSGILPVITILIYNLRKSCNVGQIDTPALFVDQDAYLVGFVWLNESSVLVEWTNRVQNSMHTYVCVLPDLCNSTISCSEIRLGSRQRIRSRLNESGWVDIKKRKVLIVKPLKATTRISYVTTELRESGGDLVRSLAKIDLMDQVGATSYLGNASHEVSELVAVDSTNRLVYYMAPEVGDTKSMQLFVTGLEADKSGNTRCVTCNVTPACSYLISVAFSASFRFFVTACQQGPVVSYVFRAVTNSNISIVLRDNEFAAAELQKYALPKREFFSLNRSTSLSGHYKLEIEMMIPESVNHAQNARFPLLLFIDNEPDSQTVSYSQKIDWLTHVCSNFDIIVAKVAARGSGNRGRQFAYAVHKNLGIIDADDQMAALNYLSELKQVDKGKIAIAGSSYGGYLVLRVLMATTTPILCAVATSPVTDWQIYSAAFAERYLGRKSQSDLSIYDRTSVLNETAWKYFNRTRLLLVHATADEKVHFEHSARLMKVLNDVQAQYSAQIYPDSHHRIESLPIRRHFTKRIVDFLRACFENRTTLFHHQPTVVQEKRRRD